MPISTQTGSTAKSNQETKMESFDRQKQSMPVLPDLILWSQMWDKMKIPEKSGPFIFSWDGAGAF